MRPTEARFRQRATDNEAKSRCQGYRQRGSQLVELAVTLPLLIFLLLLIGEGAAVLRVHQVLSNAAREGARLSSLPENEGDTADIQQQVVQYAASNGVTLTTSEITVSQSESISTGSGGCTTSSPCMSASRVEIDLNYPLTYLPRLTWVSIPANLPLQAVAEFRNFY